MDDHKHITGWAGSRRQFLGPLACKEGSSIHQSLSVSRHGWRKHGVVQWVYPVCSERSRVADWVPQRQENTGETGEWRVDLRIPVGVAGILIRSTPIESILGIVKWGPSFADLIRGILWGILWVFCTVLCRLNRNKQDFPRFYGVFGRVTRLGPGVSLQTHGWIAMV